MLPITCLVLLAASTSVELADELYRVPPRNWRYMDMQVEQRPAMVNARFEVDEGPGRVRIELMTRGNLDRLRDGLPHPLLAASGAGSSGQLLFDLPQAGDYVLVVENRGATEALVHMRVLLDFSGRRSLSVTQTTPERRAVVVILSLAVFVAVVAYSARRLRRAMER